MCIRDRAGAEALGPPIRQGPTHLLLEREEEPRPDEVDHRPQDREWLVGLRAEGAAGQPEERIGGDPVDDEAERDRHRAVGQRIARPPLLDPGRDTHEKVTLHGRPDSPGLPAPPGWCRRSSCSRPGRPFRPRGPSPPPRPTHSHQPPKNTSHNHTKIYVHTDPLHA